jgi:hypothetical protein
MRNFGASLSAYLTRPRIASAAPAGSTSAAVGRVIQRLNSASNTALSGHGYAVQQSVISLLQRQIGDGSSAVWAHSQSDVTCLINALGALALEIAAPVIQAAYDAVQSAGTATMRKYQPSLGALVCGRDR